ncbi:type II toxin-antitoxin system VapC family toxin [Nocardia sp. NPDC004068]|uniref:type II toxin-antitoxin system VapC family toxin n=1 Tax=Nocardia sp. NPDC004068 TaxID=3364303 RepID=UPI00367B3108
MSDELVVDASALVIALIVESEVGIRAAERISQSTCHAPHLIDAEVGSVLRKKERQGAIKTDRGVAALRMATLLVDQRYVHHGPLAADAWELRHTISFYDALYAALAARLEVPLLTADARLAKAPGLPCRVELLN